MVLPAAVAVLAFVLGFFVDQRHRLVVVPLPPLAQIAGAAVIMGVVGGAVGYFADGVRSVPVLIGTAALWALVAPASYLGSALRDRVSPRTPR